MLSRFVILCALAFFLFGCAEEDQPHHVKLVIAGGKTQCLSNITERIEKYFMGDLNDRQVNAFWDCTTKAVDLFKTYVRGQERQTYHANELREFLHAYFLGDIRITDLFLQELMQVKRLFLGGSDTHVSQMELVQLAEFLNLLRDHTLHLQPHIKLLAAPWEKGTPQPTPEDVDRAIGALRTVGLDLAKRIQNNKVDYSFVHFQRLLQETADLFTRQNPESRLHWLPRLAPLVARLKSLLVSPDIDQVQTGDWLRLLDVGVGFYDIWLRYSYFLTEYDWRMGVGLEQIAQSIRRGEELIRLPLSQRGSGGYSRDEIYALLEEFNAIVPLNGMFNVDVLKLAWNLLTEKILFSAESGRPPGHFTVGQFQIFLDEFERWRITQARIARGEALSETPDEELDRIVKSAPWPLRNDEQGRLLLNGKHTKPHDLKSLSLLNLEKTFIRQLIRGYATESDRRDGIISLSLAELETVFVDFKPLAVRMGLLSESNNTFHKRLFQEGNLFLPRSNGDAWIGFEEGVEYLHYALSGVNASELIRLEMKDQCGIQSRGNIIGYDPECTRLALISNFNLHYSHLSMMTAFFSQLTPLAAQKFIRSIEETVRGAAVGAGTPFTSTDLVEMSVLLQYIETFAQRFDLNGNETIDVGEVMAAYPVFNRTLSELLDFLGSEDDITAFFTYMFRYGSPPDPAQDALAELRFRYWKYHPTQWEFEADRARLAQILWALAKFSQ